jgi:hypothetical protein
MSPVWHAILLDTGFALLFWIVSLMVLGALSVACVGVEAALTPQPPAAHAARQAGQAPLSPGPSRLEAVRELAKLAPVGGNEIAAWTLLCLPAIDRRGLRAALFARRRSVAIAVLTLARLSSSRFFDSKQPIPDFAPKK